MRLTAQVDHRDGVDERNQHSHTQIGVDQRARRLVSFVEVGGPAEPEVDRHQ